MTFRGHNHSGPSSIIRARANDMTWALRARALLLVFEKCTHAYLFQIALEIM